MRLVYRILAVVIALVLVITHLDSIQFMIKNPMLFDSLARREPLQSYALSLGFNIGCGVSLLVAIIKQKRNYWTALVIVDLAVSILTVLYYLPDWGGPH